MVEIKVYRVDRLKRAIFVLPHFQEGLFPPPFIPRGFVRGKGSVGALRAEPIGLEIVVDLSYHFFMQFLIAFICTISTPDVGMTPSSNVVPSCVVKAPVVLVMVLHSSRLEATRQRLLEAERSNEDLEARCRDEEVAHASAIESMYRRAEQ